VKRYLAELGLDPKEARMLAEERPIAEYFEAAVAAVVTTSVVSPETAQAVTTEAKTVSNWITGELFRLMNATDVEIAAIKITPAAFAGLLRLVDAGQINLNSAKRVFGVMFETGRGAAEVVQELGLAQVSDTDALAAAVAKVLAQNAGEVAKYRGGKESLFNWFLGQVMRETRGKGNPAVVKELLARALGS